VVVRLFLRPNMAYSVLGLIPAWWTSGVVPELVTPRLIPGWWTRENSV
jgi:hypothetical protein